MIEWGISAASHNAALAVFKDDKLVFASESERFSRIKNDPDLHPALIDYAKNWGEPELIHWYEKPWLKSWRQWKSGQGLISNSPKKYLANYKLNAPIKTVKHHHSHAAGAYFTSKFDEACVVVIDAIGEFDTMSIWKAEGNKLTQVKSLKYPHSIGLWYSAMTQRVGLKPNEEEYILMGMAAYGNPDRLTGKLLSDFFNLPSLEQKENFHRGCHDWRKYLTSEKDMFDIAAGTQAVYEFLLSAVMREARELTQSENLVFTGGCALNCAANPLLFAHFSDVWIMPAPGDNGSSIGAVLANKKQHIDWPGPFLGYDIGSHATNAEIVDYLLEHKMCGIARGKAEFGPRALGNRSLIADPRGPEIKGLINTIKKRQQFRPFSPSILDHFAKSHFYMPTKSTPYMQYIAPCTESESYPAIVHHDGTSRVQTVSVLDNRQYYDLLDLWYAKTGCPMLLNTSLNIKGEPIVNDYADAIKWSQKFGVKIFN